MDEIRILSQPFPGYGFPRESIERGFEENPHVLVSQGTSTDPGPYYLGSGKPFVGYNPLKRDLEILITRALEHDAIFICSLIGSGSNIDLERGLKIVDEISEENKLRFEAAVISGEINKDWLKRKLKEGAETRRLVPHPKLPERLTEDDVDRSIRVVAQMGPEPIMKALDANVKFVFTGRALDTGLIVAVPLREGFSPALAYHMAKMIECGALCATPGTTSDPALGILRRDHFLVRCPNPLRKCTPTSCASHSFYERADPFREENPGGYLDITTARYEQYDERTVKVWGSRWVPTPYTIKLEGAAVSGYRTITIAGVRCPVIISKIDEIMPQVASFVKSQLLERGVKESDYRLMFRVYGKNGVMGPWEPQENVTSHEMCVIIDVVAKTQRLADDVCALARSTLLHWGFPERISTAGNLAFPFSPSDISLGEVYEWSIFHTIRIDDPLEPFPIKIVEFPRG